MYISHLSFIDLMEGIVRVRKQAGLHTQWKEA